MSATSECVSVGWGRRRWWWGGGGRRGGGGCGCDALMNSPEMLCIPLRLNRKAEEHAKVYLDCQAKVAGTAVLPLTDAIKEQMFTGM